MNCEQEAPSTLCHKETDRSVPTVQCGTRTFVYSLAQGGVRAGIESACTEGKTPFVPSGTVAPVSPSSHASSFAYLAVQAAHCRRCGPATFAEGNTRICSDVATEKVYTGKAANLP